MPPSDISDGLSRQGGSNTSSTQSFPSLTPASSGSLQWFTVTRLFSQFQQEVLKHYFFDIICLHTSQRGRELWDDSRSQICTFESLCWILILQRMTCALCLKGVELTLWMECDHFFSKVHLSLKHNITHLLCLLPACKWRYVWIFSVN